MVNLALPKRTVTYHQSDGNLDVEAVFTTADGTASMIRTRLSLQNAEAVANPDSREHGFSVEQGSLFLFTYPDFVALCRKLEIRGKVLNEETGQLEDFTFSADLMDDIPFELYCQLPETFLVDCETAMYELNPHWRRDLESLEDPKLSVVPNGSTIA